jgi:hypothetical protein
LASQAFDVISAEAASRRIVALRGQFTAVHDFAPLLLRKSYEADSEARRAIQDRIFISNRVQWEKILERWQLVTAEKDGSIFWSAWNDLHTALIKAAHEDLGLKK